MRAARAADRPPRYERRPQGSLVDTVEPQVRVLLKDAPRMQATVIAQRIGWTHSITTLKDRVRLIRPKYVAPDPPDRLVHEPGQAIQCDLSFPPTPIPPGHGQARQGERAGGAFAGSPATRIRLLPPRDPQSKGVVERTKGFLETSFLPGRMFTGPDDFNEQLAGWLPTTNQRLVRATGARPGDAVEVDRAAKTPLPRLAPAVGLRNRVRLGRDYSSA